MLGNYTIKVSTSSMPQKVATGLDKVFEGFTGAKYEFIAYLGSQVVNGTNHAILAKQTLITAKDVTSLALVILNEKPGDVAGETLSIAEIQRLITDEGLMGGFHIDPMTTIPEEALKVFNMRFGKFVGATNKPIALVATQVVNGMAYIFAVESSRVVAPAAGASVSVSPVEISLVKIFSNYDTIETVCDVLSGSSVAENAKYSETKFGYAFTW